MDVRELKDKATQLFSKGKFAKAAEAWDEYCKADQKDLQARLRLGDAWSKAGKKDKAVTAYTWAAEGFAKEGFLPRAIAASKLVLELDPAHKGVQKMLADLYARKTGTPAARPGLSAPPSKAGEEIITRTNEAPGTAAGFAKRADAIDLDAPVAKPGKGAAAKAPEQPSPMNRADALELPEYEIPMGEGPSLVGGMASAKGPSPLRRSDAIEIADVAPAAAPVDRPGPADAGIEIELTAAGPVTGEVEIPIEGEPLPPAPALPPELAVPGERLVPASTPSQPPVVAGLPLSSATPPPVVAGEALPPPPPPPQPAPVPSALDSASAARLSPPPPPIAVYELDVEAEPEPIDLTHQVEEAEPIPLTTRKTPVPQVAPPPPPPDTLGPPGLRPKGSTPSSIQPAPPSSSPSSRIWLPPTFATPAPMPATVAPAPSASAAPPAHVEAVTDLEKSLQTFMSFEPEAVLPPRPPAAKSFTELDMEGDTLLHAVEAAATSASGATVAPAEEAMEAPEEPKPEPGALPKIPLFSDLPEDAFIALFEQCPLRRFDERQLILEQGTKGDAFYVICAGRVRVFRTDGGERRDLATLEEGTFFGEMALLSEAPRSASVEAAAEDTQVLEISAAVLTDLSKKHPSVATALKKFCRQRMLSNLMSSAPLFRPFSRGDRRDLVQKFRARDVKKGDPVIKEGAMSDGLYLILSGEVEVSVKGRRVAALKEGDVFGEMSLLSRAPATATVVSSRHTSLLRLPREDFDRLILSHPQILAHVSELTDERAKQNAAAQMV